MPVQHKYRPHHLPLAIAIALGCADFAIAQQIPEAPTPVETPDDLIMTLDAFINDPGTLRTPVAKGYKGKNEPALQLTDADDLITVLPRGSFSGLLDGGGGTNVLQLDAPKGGTLGETRNINGLEVKQGNWTLKSTDFSIGALVRPNAALINEGHIEGKVLTLGRVENKGNIGDDAFVLSTGSLTNRGIIGGNVDVSEQGSFAGDGSVGGLAVRGRLNVDNLHGAPTVAGDLKLSNTAVLVYGITANAPGETINVKGTATLGDATLKLVAAPGDYPQSGQHTIIRAENFVEGKFGTIENNLAFMTPSLQYPEREVVLTYARNEVPFESVATTENGREFARSLKEPISPAAPSPTRTENAPVAQQPSNAAVTALLASNKETASQAIELLAGDSNANLAKATLASDSPVGSSMLSAIRQLDSTSAYSNPGRRNNAPRLAAGSEDNGRVWLQALGHNGKLDRDVYPLQHTTEGLLLGADWRIDEEWRLGLMGGKSRTRLESSELDGDLDSWHLGVYALRQNGPMSLRLGATYSGHDGSNARRIAFAGFSDRPKGSYDASTQQAFAEVGYNLGRTNVSIEPFASLGYQRYQRDSYTEKGGAAALKVHEQAQSNMNSTFGLRLAKVNTLDNGMQLTPRFSAGWKHTYGEVDTKNRQRLVNGGNDYTVYGAELDRDSLMLDAGLDLGVSTNHTVGVGLTGEIASDSRNHGVMGQWRMAF
ncbi:MULTISPECIES: autotransporter domain-containing protein [Pseudomonas]|uniref:Autotransporter outer membrane beta-barrel domain-containing protein n=1 Tax=Pseudomonas lini TaxID=163011 RepID=A0A423IRQ3_9PSED|nr:MULTISPECIES: autotransporter domain-containing protein [Pseudomonas]RON28080.1 autotransporter outer membrane beta-barrel domain-containing protein [Pseudomonas lini]